MLGIITLKVQKNITVVGKVTLHVWTSNWGQRPAAAAKALNKWDGGRAHRGKWAYRLPCFGVRGWRYRFKLQTCASWCILEFKNKHFIQKHLNVHQLPTLNYHLPQTSANYLVLDNWRPVQEKVHNLMFNLDFMWSIWWHQVIKSGMENRRFFVPLLKARRTLPSCRMFRVPWLGDENKM